jgi:Tol biopolymer transport system component
VAAAAILAGCGGSGGGSDTDQSPRSTATELPTSIPIGTSKPVELEGEVIIYRNTLEADAVASTLDHGRTFSLDYDATVDSVIAINCAQDGSRAAYLLENGVTLESRVVIADASGRREIPFPGSALGAALSPDGESVAVTSYLPDNARSVLSVLDVASGKIASVYNRAGTIGPPAWSPDSQKIVFHALTDQDNQLFVYTLGESDAEQVTTSPMGAFSPDWSRDGSLIAFSSVPDSGGAQIFTVPAAGGDATQLTSTQAFKANPRWSPDGSSLAYVGTRSVPTVSRLPMLSLHHNVGVFTSAADGGNEALFTDYAIDAWLLGWCKAGPWLGQGWTEQ